MKKLVLLLALGFTAAAFAQVVPPVPVAPAVTPGAGDALVKELADVKAQNANLQISVQYFQIVADRNALGIQVLNLTKQVTDLTVERDSLKGQLDQMKLLKDGEQAKVETLLKEVSKLTGNANVGVETKHPALPEKK